MVVQYPHYLFVVKSDEESVQDENGNWIEELTSTVFVTKCREETNGRGNELQVGNGLFHKYSSLIQMPKGAQRVTEGTTVFVANDAECTDIRMKGTVLKFDSGQLHCRMWID
jgi:hypothetical protein